VSLGTILGSNIFNGLFIVAVAAVIYPISVSWREVAVALVLGFVAVALTILRAEVLSNKGVGCHC
jgi:cation:H+ antiporter